MYGRTHVLIALLAHARSDWVQISQHHYINKPVKLLDPVTDNVHPLTSDNIYPNNSLSDRFNKGVVQRVSPKGSVKLVNIESTNVKSAFFNVDINKTQLETKSNRVYDPVQVLNDAKPDFVTKNDQIKLEDETLYNNEEYHKINDIPIAKKENKKNSDNYKESIDDSSTSDAKVKTTENLLKFLTVVATTISKNTRRSVASKVNYLEDLKNTLLVNIEGRIESLWPQEGARAARVSRGAREHVQFPSSESALMTISFLTFAVFLIKLVLQVIQTYKMKAMMVSPTVLAAVGRN